VDGKLRYDGAGAFLESRGINLPKGDPSAPAGYDSVCGLGNLKDKIFQQLFDKEGVEVFPGAVELLERFRSRGVRTAVVSASNSCRQILKAAGIIDKFDAIVDGLEASELNLPGKPLPHTFLRAAELLQAQPENAIVLEDAVSGVQAGRDGGFGLVVGVDRKDNHEALKAHGADLVVKDPGELLEAVAKLTKI
jgi:HAD superfamily hydrolase (TIGR01509 family)